MDGATQFSFTASLSELTVRHTPAFVFVHHFAIGTDSATHPGLRPPLSERGWRGGALLIIKMMRMPIPSRRGVAEGRGVSHHQAVTGQSESHHQSRRTKTGSELRLPSKQLFYALPPTRLFDKFLSKTYHTSPR